jgi:hypothetical protein
MIRGDRIISVVGCALAIAACSNKKEVEYAKHSVYDADFVQVYNAVFEVTRDLYPNMDDNPGHGRVSTAWHQVQYASTQDDMANPRTVAQQQGMNPTGTSPAAGAAGMPTRLAFKRFFIRFDVSVVGGRPWRVKVAGHAAEWEPGAAMPVELHGIARPPWLEGRTEALQVAIYKRIKQYAVPMKEEVKAEVEEDKKTDPATFKGVPEPAAKRLAAIKDALAKRDYAGLRPQLADDIVWSLGGGTGADVAIATWQADPATFDAMTGAIVAGCATDGDKRVKCPAGAEVAGRYQLVIEPRDDTWKISSFVKAE